MYTYSFLILCIDSMLPACRPNCCFILGK